MATLDEATATTVDLLRLAEGAVDLAGCPEAYRVALERTHTPRAPWYVVPAERRRVLTEDPLR